MSLELTTREFGVHCLAAPIELDIQLNFVLLYYNNNIRRRVISINNSSKLQLSLQNLHQSLISHRIVPIKLDQLSQQHQDFNNLIVLRCRVESLCLRKTLGSWLHLA
jgi:hypothetical protein